MQDILQPDVRQPGVLASGYDLSACRGAVFCRHAAAPAARLARDFEQALEGRNLGVFLAQHTSGSIKSHHRFRVSVSACPNGCSRPQIADLGLVGATVPMLSGEDCLGCGSCVSACRERAVSLAPDMGGPDGAQTPRIAYSQCLTCGACADVCPSGAISRGPTGWRLFVGGRMGRHPALGQEITGLYDDEEALAVLEACLDLHMAHFDPKVRFGEMLEALKLNPVVASKAVDTRVFQAPLGIG